jgi:hypothetical protein
MNKELMEKLNYDNDEFIKSFLEDVDKVETFI